jgi:hypothetical protein
MPFEKEKWPSAEPPRKPERRYETHPAGPGWTTQKEAEEERKRRQEDPNWFREQE